MIGLAFSKSFGPLLANRFLLGMFEAVNIPLFSECSSSALSAKSHLLTVPLPRFSRHHHDLVPAP